MLMKEPAPGSPDSCTTVTFGAFAASASTTLTSPAFWIAEESTWLRTFPSFSVSMAVPAPVTTTSPSCKGLEARRKSCVTIPPLRVILTDWDL